MIFSFLTKDRIEERVVPQMASSLFGMMNTSTTGMMVNQSAINVTSNNITNVNTDGYTRQRAHIRTNGEIYYRGLGYLGTGAQIADINRIRDQHLETQIRNETSIYKEYEVKGEVLGEIEMIFNEPSDTGLNALLSRYWSAWEEVSKHPENATLKTSVVESAVALSDLFNHLNTQVDKAVEDTESRLNQQIEQATSIIERMNVLNESIERAYRQDPTRTPNDLLDQRDALARQLSEYLPVEVKIEANGTIGVTTTFADGTTQDVLAMTRTDLVDKVDQLKTGTIKGYYEMSQEIQGSYGQRLDELGQTLADSLNAVQGFNFFEYDPANVAGTIKVNPDLVSGKLSVNVGTDGVGDNRVALEVLKLRDETFTMNGQDVTMEQFYKQLISDIGIKTQHAESMIESQDKLLTFLDNQYLSISGVSLDEEIVNLVQFQKAYDANAKVISTITTMLDTIINQMGV